MTYRENLKNSVLGLDASIWSRYDYQDHETFRHVTIKEELSKLHYQANLKTILDIGAGSQPYRNHIMNLDLHYVAHDFGEYSENLKNQYFGLHNAETPLHSPDLICDVLEIPEKDKFDLVLCTEVLEHVPNPVELIRKITNLLNDNGYLILTVPGNSWTHQAPYYFSSGLSPFWFEYHLKNMNAKIIKGFVVGNLKTTVYQSMRSLESLHARSLWRILGYLYRKTFDFRYENINCENNLYQAPISQIILIAQKVT